MFLAELNKKKNLQSLKEKENKNGEMYFLQSKKSMETAFQKEAVINNETE